MDEHPENCLLFESRAAAVRQIKMLDLFKPLVFSPFPVQEHLINGIEPKTFLSCEDLSQRTHFFSFTTQHKVSCCLRWQIHLNSYIRTHFSHTHTRLKGSVRTMWKTCRVERADRERLMAPPLRSPVICFNANKTTYSKR